MAQRKRRHDLKNVDQAAADGGASAPSPGDCKQRRWQEQREQEQQMICAFRDVPGSKPEGGAESAPRDALRGCAAQLAERHVVDRLVLVAGLRSQGKPLILRNKAIDQIHGDATLVMVHKPELMLTAGCCEGRRKRQFDLTGTLLHPFGCWESRRDQVQRQPLAVFL